MLSSSQRFSLQYHFVLGQDVELFSLQSHINTSCMFSRLEYQYFWITSKSPRVRRFLHLVQSFPSQSGQTKRAHPVLDKAVTDYFHRPLSVGVLLVHVVAHFSGVKILFPSCSIAARRKSVSLLQGNQSSSSRAPKLVRSSNYASATMKYAQATGF